MFSDVNKGFKGAYVDDYAAYLLGYHTESDVQTEVVVRILFSQELVAGLTVKFYSTYDIIQAGYNGQAVNYGLLGVGYGESLVVA